LVPEPVLARFNRAHQRCAIRNLALLNELVHITSALRSAGVEAISYKGPLLARDVYGDWGLRESADLDVMIRRNDFARTRTVLANAGYQSAQLLDETVEKARLITEGQCQFMRGDFSLDIHCRAFPHYLWSDIDTESWFTRAREASAANGTALVLQDDDLLLALVLHGTKHAWSRLIWLCDVAELLRQQPDRCAKLLECAAGAHALRATRLALLLCNRLLDVPLSAEIARDIQRDHEVGQLYECVVRDLWVPTTSSPWRWKFLLDAQDTQWQRLRSSARFALTPTIREYKAFGCGQALAPLRSLARATDVIRTVVLQGLRRPAPDRSRAREARAAKARSADASATSSAM
jgi:hypothetical protein